MALAEAVAFQRLDRRLAGALLGHGAKVQQLGVLVGYAVGRQPTSPNRQVRPALAHPHGADAVASAEVLPRAEVAAVLAAPMSRKARTLLMTAYATGMRVSELCNLCGCDIDASPDRMPAMPGARPGWRSCCRCRMPPGVHASARPQRPGPMP